MSGRGNAIRRLRQVPHVCRRRYQLESSSNRKLRSSLLEQALLLCRVEQSDLQVESINRILSIAQILLVRISAKTDEKTDTEEIQDSRIDSINSPYTGRTPAIVIGHLPVEILLSIFYYYRDENTTTRLSLLMRVSRGWRDIVLSSPGLWSRINLAPTGFLTNTTWYYSHISTCLQRSGDLPLDITVDFTQIEQITGHLDTTLEMLLPPGYMFDTYGCGDWGFNGAYEDMIRVYHDQFVDILRLLAGLPPSSTFMDYTRLGTDEDHIAEISDLQNGLTLSSRHAFSRWQSLQWTLPSSFPPDILPEVCSLLAYRMPLLRRLSIKSDWECKRPIVWPRSDSPRFQALCQLSFNFPVVLDSISCNPSKLRDLTIHVDVSSLEAIRRFTSLERLALIQVYGLPSGVVNPSPIFLPHLRHLQVDAGIPKSFPLNFHAPSLQKLTLVFDYRVQLVDLNLLSTVKTLDLAVDGWLRRSSNSKETRPYSSDELNCFASLLNSCSLLESLRVWECTTDPKGTILRNQIISSVLKGNLEFLRDVTFLKPMSSSEMEHAMEVVTYHVATETKKYRLR